MLLIMKGELGAQITTSVLSEPGDFKIHVQLDRTAMALFYL